MKKSKKLLFIGTISVLAAPALAISIASAASNETAVTNDYDLSESSNADSVKATVNSADADNITVTVSGTGKMDKSKWKNLFDSTIDRAKVKTIEITKGVLFPDNSDSLFWNFPKAEINIYKDIDTTNVTNMVAMFAFALKANPDVSNWHTENVTNMRAMFIGAKSADPDVSGWDVSKVTNFGDLFKNSLSKNLNVKDWKVQSSTIFYSMFEGIEGNPDVSKWDVSNATFMASMFKNAKNADPKVSSWNMENVTSTESMFEGATAANPDVSSWKLKNVTNTSKMFKNATSANPDVSSWVFPKLRKIDNMFEGATAANPDVSKWNTENVESMNGVFKNATSANPDVSKWNLKNARSTSSMFEGATAANPDVSKWKVENIDYMDSMFKGATSANPDVSKWKTHNLKYANHMFEDTTIADPDVSGWDTSNLEQASSMFKNSLIANPDVSKWNTKKLSQAQFMFYGAKKANPNIANWNFDKIYRIDYFLYGATSADIDVSMLPEDNPLFKYVDWNFAKVRSIKLTGKIIKLLQNKQNLHINLNESQNGIFTENEEHLITDEFAGSRPDYNQINKLDDNTVYNFRSIVNDDYTIQYLEDSKNAIDNLKHLNQIQKDAFKKALDDAKGKPKPSIEIIIQNATNLDSKMKQLLDAFNGDLQDIINSSKTSLSKKQKATDLKTEIDGVKDTTNLSIEDIDEYLKRIKELKDLVDVFYTIEVKDTVDIKNILPSEVKKEYFVATPTLKDNQKLIINYFTYDDNDGALQVVYSITNTPKNNVSKMFMGFKKYTKENKINTDNNTEIPKPIENQDITNKNTNTDNSTQIINKDANQSNLNTGLNNNQNNLNVEIGKKPEQSQNYSDKNTDSESKPKQSQNDSDKNTDSESKPKLKIQSPDRTKLKTVDKVELKNKKLYQKLLIVTLIAIILTLPVLILIIKKVHDKK